MTTYDKHPFIPVSQNPADCARGWAAIADRLRSTGGQIIAIDTYPGVNDAEILEFIREHLRPERLLLTADALKPRESIEAMTRADVTDDPVFGFITRLSLDNFFDAARLERLRNELVTGQFTVIYGVGAARVTAPDVLVYADLARWEIQMRMRRNEIANLGLANHAQKWSLKYKRAFFVDWRVADEHKRRVFDRIDFLLDTNAAGDPKLITGRQFRSALDSASRRPFRVVPFFDPAPWGGQWMKEVCDLDRSAANYGWCFDCVPEENSLLLGFGDVRVEIPSIDLVFAHPRELLGEAVYGRFGAEFPIRFDFLDTMGGGNLSFQVHPLTEYIRRHFGMGYTQDESYYLLEAGDDGCVYLGLKEGINPGAMGQDLRAAATGAAPFDADKYANCFPARKHDHFLIPAGTVHCSGRNSMVLEISATPYIFTFKLWDWGRLGLDGLPRPVHLDHGLANVQWDRTTEWVKRHLVNAVSPIGRGDGWHEERTGLHDAEFIETRRHWFTGVVPHHTRGGVNVLNLVQGDSAVVESPTGAFEPFPVHYAETFIVPAAVGAYTIRPTGRGEHATIKAFVRTGTHVHAE